MDSNALPTDRFHRRQFLKSLSATLAVSALPWNQSVWAESAPTSDQFGKLLPTRPLGRSGVPVTTLCVGGGHVISDMDEAGAEQAIDQAMESGIRFFDTAESYGKGASEERYGRYLCPKYREAIYLMTKTRARTAKEAEEHLEGSLSRMKTDVIDLWQIHDITSPEDVDERLDNGVLDFMLKAQAAGKVKQLGFTGHTHPAAFTHMIKRLDARGTPLAAAQMPINVVDPHYLSFLVNVLPVLVDKGYGVLAMKTLAYGQLLGKQTSWKKDRRAPQKPVVGEMISLEEALGFAWSLPIASLVSGMTNPAEIKQNAGICRSYPDLDDTARTQLIEKVADQGGPMVEFYKAASA